MKLIDLLVQELPKRCWWPDGAGCITVIEYHMGGDLLMEFIFPSIRESNLHGKSYQVIINDVGYIERIMCDDPITKEQYESALAASQKPAWNGEGVPPVGCECEYLDNNGKWYPVTIKYASNQLVVISGITKILGVEQGAEIAKDIIIDKPQFRPLRAESERKHEAVLESICAVLEMVAQDYKREDEAKLIYEAIAAGKIPGVKLDD